MTAWKVALCIGVVIEVVLVVVGFVVHRWEPAIGGAIGAGLDVLMFSLIGDF